MFLPLTRLCRDTCGYCTFAQPPVPGRRAYMTLPEVLDVAGRGAELGCTEALFTLGAPPPARWALCAGPSACAVLWAAKANWQDSRQDRIGREFHGAAWCGRAWPRARLAPCARQPAPAGPCAGDKPEAAHAVAAAELATMGHGSTLEYVAQAAGAVLAATGLLPHVNAGVMGEADLLRLRRVSASQVRRSAACAGDRLQPCVQHR